VKAPWYRQPRRAAPGRTRRGLAPSCSRLDRARVLRAGEVDLSQLLVGVAGRPAGEAGGVAGVSGLGSGRVRLGPARFRRSADSTSASAAFGCSTAVVQQRFESRPENGTRKPAWRPKPRARWAAASPTPWVQVCAVTILVGDSVSALAPDSLALDGVEIRKDAFEARTRLESASSVRSSPQPTNSTVRQFSS
jgi:hypothetical protein